MDMTTLLDLASLVLVPAILGLVGWIYKIDQRQHESQQIDERERADIRERIDGRVAALQKEIYRDFVQRDAVASLEDRLTSRINTLHDDLRQIDDKLTRLLQRGIGAE